MPEDRWRPSFGAWMDGDEGIVRVWAPEASTVTLREAKSPHRGLTPSGEFAAHDETISTGAQFSRKGLTPVARDVRLERDERGFFSGRSQWLRPGSRYCLVLDDEHAFPDPASRFQPQGVHGPSELIDPSTFAWQTTGWRGRPLDELVIYELHVGTFTAEGTFAAAADRLAALAALGVTAVELMPLAAFPGRRNWGYDPAAQFAPSENYGRPDDLRRFVDRAHELGLSVLLDVVYNHFGPDGAYAAAFSRQFFSQRHESPWGAGINLDGPGADAVRAFFVENALHWLIEYRMDGLRLDATHALIDDSREHLLAELARIVHARIRDRDVVLIAEDNRNLRTIVEPIAAGGWGFDADWTDDFHHVARRLIAGDDESYFRDFAGTTNELARTLRDGWLFRGERSVHMNGPRGTDPSGLPLASFVICLQNHDQVGNRALGDRLHHGVDLAVYRALSVLLLLAPETPLLFMGQEWAASAPFFYFTDHGEELGRLVRDGRRQEFGQFRAFADEDARERIPDPQDVATFERSRLDWTEREEPPHAGIAALYQQLLALRRTLQPCGLSGSIDETAIEAVDAHGLFMRRSRRDGTEMLIVARFTGAGSVRVPHRATGGSSDRPAVVLDTETTPFAVDAAPAGVTSDETGITVAFARPGAVVIAIGTAEAVPYDRKANA